MLNIFIDENTTPNKLYLLRSEDGDLRIRVANPWSRYGVQTLLCKVCTPPKTESEDAHACSEDGDLRILMANPWSRPYAPEDRGQSTRRCLAHGKRDACFVVCRATSRRRVSVFRGAPGTFGLRPNVR
jgi:hypothetical protein